MGREPTVAGGWKADSRSPLFFAEPWLRLCQPHYRQRQDKAAEHNRVKHRQLRPRLFAAHSIQGNCDGQRSESQADQIGQQPSVRGLRQAHKIAAGLGWRASDGAFAGSGKAPTSSYERRLWPLVFLAPDIQQAILEGRQPPALTLDQLLKMRLPTDWAEQRRTLCFDGK